MSTKSNSRLRGRGGWLVGWLVSLTVKDLVLGVVALLRLERVGRDLFVVLLEGSQVLTGLAELAFLHTLADVPVDEGALAVHEVELVVEAGPRFGDGSSVGQHRHGSLDGGQSAITGGGGGDGDGLLVVDADLEAGRAPLDQVEGGLGLEGGDSGVAVARYNVATVQESDSHVLAVPRVTDYHLIVGLEA